MGASCTKDAPAIRRDNTASQPGDGSIFNSPATEGPATLDTALELSISPIDPTLSPQRSTLVKAHSTIDRTSKLLDERQTRRLATFCQRNKRENIRHATLMAGCETQSSIMKQLAEMEGGKEKVERYDVFSPDMRSTRWQEFIEIFADNMEQYDRYKRTSSSVRGAGKALTIAAVTRDNDDDLGDLH